MSNFEKVLKDSGVPISEAAIEAEFKQVVTDSGSRIANDSAYSPFWRIVRQLVIKPTLWLIQELLIKRVMPQFFLKTVGEGWIDLWGDSYGVTRKGSQVLQGRVLFSRSDVSADLEIAVGTSVYTDEINGSVYRLFTSETVTLKAGEDAKLVAVTAENAGAAYNLESGYYRHCDVELTVINPQEWIDVLGADAEKIEAYRLRIRNAFNTLSHFHTDGVYRALISEFGGIDADKIWFKHNAPRGPGTANAYVLFELDTPSASFLETINRRISAEGHHGHGDDLRVFPMPETHHSLTVIVHLPDSLMDVEREETLSGVRLSIEAAFRSNSAFIMTRVSPWSRFSFTRLASEIYANFPDIVSINFDQNDIVSEMSVPRLSSLIVTEGA
uniref:Uncharacterized phage Mu protein GP47-like protein n=1 Tax=Marinomonas sp. (strain MWYL1) TaxID=400668 RepID=A6VSS8_MARMS